MEGAESLYKCNQEERNQDGGRRRESTIEQSVHTHLSIHCTYLSYLVVWTSANCVCY